MNVSLRVTAPDGSVREQTSAIAEGASGAQVALAVANPQLWWPNGYGERPLYGVEVVLSGGSANQGADRPIDRRTYELGLRTIELRQEPDRWGRSFEFVVNGVPIFAKGANWIPADTFPTRIGDAFLEGLIRSAAESHQNMLRVWGGGFYEEERFYDLCDRYGILVWQEFIFCLQHLSAGRAGLCRQRSRRDRSRTCAACVIAPAWRFGAATTRWSRAG